MAEKPREQPQAAKLAVAENAPEAAATSPAEEKSAEQPAPEAKPEEPKPEPPSEELKESAQEAKKETEKPSTLAAVNVVLSLVGVAVISFYFYLHLRAWLSMYAIGGVSLFATGGLIYAIVEAIKHDALKPFVGKVLKSRIYLVVALVVLVVTIALFGVTSSISIALSSAEGAKGPYKVTIKPPIDGLSSLSVDEEEKTRGKAFFLRTEDVQVVLQIDNAPQYHPLTARRFRMWTPIHVKVPREFPRKSFRLVRLIPGVGLRLPRLADSPEYPYRLEVTRIVPGGEEPLAEVSDWRMQTLQMGADESEILHVFREAEATTSPEGILKRYLTTVDPLMPEPNRNEYLAFWTSPPRIRKSRKYMPGDRLRIRLVQTSRPEEREVLDQNVTVVGETVATWFLEVVNGKARIVDSTRQLVH